MRVLIIQEIIFQADYWTGSEMLAEKIGKERDAYFYENNSGPGKLFPEGSSCTVRGKVVPCFVCF